MEVMGYQQWAAWHGAPIFRPEDRDGQELRTRGGTFMDLVTWQEVPDLFAEKPGDRYATPKLSSKSGAKPEFAPIL